MACLTKTKKRMPRPRCEAKTDAGHRCKYYGVEYIGPWCFCIRHAYRIKQSNLKKTKEQKANVQTA